MLNRAEVRKKIPYGYGKLIADRAGVSQRFVSKFFNDENVKSKKVANVTLQVLEELKSNEQEFNNRLQAALS